MEILLLEMDGGMLRFEIRSEGWRRRRRKEEEIVRGRRDEEIGGRLLEIEKRGGRDGRGLETTPNVIELSSERRRRGMEKEGKMGDWFEEEEGERGGRKGDLKEEEGRGEEREEMGEERGEDDEMGEDCEREAGGGGRSGGGRIVRE
ncbi:hypothetical protein Tco_0491794 [Tanacetum coccineum]